MPCPHDPCPDLVDPCPKIWGPFLWKKKCLRQRTHKFRASRNMGTFFVKKKRRLRQRTHKPRASRNMGPFFAEKKKAPAATYPQVQSFQKYGGRFLRKKQICPPWDSGRKTRFSNGLADNRSKVSVKKSQTGFVVINFSRSLFPYM